MQLDGQQLNFWIAIVFPKKGFRLAACIREESFVNKINRGRCAFYV
jgi:hypothetical protein